MSEHLHPGSHPEPDLLNAFLEGALAEHERLECLTHLSGCSRCREIVFLAQKAQPAAAVVPAASEEPWWRRWRTPVPVLSGAALAGLLVAGLWIFMARETGTPAKSVLTASIPVPPVSLTVPKASSESTAPTQPHQPIAAPKPVMPVLVPPPSVAMGGIASEPAVGYGGGIGKGSGAGIAATVPVTPPFSDVKILAGNLRVEHAQGPASDSGHIVGSVTDASGAVIPGATITIVAGTTTQSAKSDPSGRFEMPSLPPGRYDMQILAPGFERVGGQVELQAQDLARVTSVLKVGSVAETVEVSSASPTVSTSAAILLPSIAPPANTTVEMGKVKLRINADGGLSYSKGAGKHWKPVKQTWPGKVVQLRSRAESPASPAAFEITTDSGAVWLSRDGAHWFAEAPKP